MNRVRSKTTSGEPGAGVDALGGGGGRAEVPDILEGGRPCYY